MIGRRIFYDCAFYPQNQVFPLIVIPRFVSLAKYQYFSQVPLATNSNT